MLNNSLWVVQSKKVQDTIINYKTETRNFRKGSYIYYQNDLSEHLYFLLDGRVSVNILSSNGSEKTLAIHEPGSFFGETAFFDGSPNFSNAYALKDSTILLFDKSHINQLMHDNPDIMLHIFEDMSRKIRLLSFQVESLSFMNVEERLVSLLIKLFSSFGAQCNKSSLSSCQFEDKCINGQFLELTITDKEIGEMVGARREAITKSLNNLRRQNLIYKNKRVICCPDLSKLDEFLADKI